MSALDWLLAFPGSSDPHGAWLPCHQHQACSRMGEYHVATVPVTLAPSAEVMRRASDRGLDTIVVAVDPPGTRYFWAPPGCVAHCRAYVERTLDPTVPRDPSGDPIPPGWYQVGGGFYHSRGRGFSVDYVPLSSSVASWRANGFGGGRSNTLPGAMCLALGLLEHHELWDPEL